MEKGFVGLARIIVMSRIMHFRKDTVDYIYIYIYVIYSLWEHNFHICAVNELGYCGLAGKPPSTSLRAFLMYLLGLIHACPILFIVVVVSAIKSDATLMKIQCHGPHKKTYADS